MCTFRLEPAQNEADPLASTSAENESDAMEMTESAGKESNKLCPIVEIVSRFYIYIYILLEGMLFKFDFLNWIKFCP